MTTLRDWTRLMFGPDPDAPPLGVLWDLIAVFVVWVIVAGFIHESDCPHDLGGED